MLAPAMVNDREALPPALARFLAVQRRRDDARPVARLIDRAPHRVERS